jgi:hypothetical protein
LNRWKIEHAGFRESIHAGKIPADAAVAESLYRAAVGGGIVTEIREEPDGEGKVTRKKITRELPPDVRAQRYWLGNRHPKLWRDKVVLEDATPTDMLAAKARRFDEIMADARQRQRDVLIRRGLIPSDGEPAEG